MTDSVVKLPSAKILNSLSSQVNTAKSKASTLNGEAGQKIAEAVEKHNVHAGAFKQCNRLVKMDPVKLKAFLTHFDDYREKMGIDAMAADDLPEQEEEKKPPPPMFTEGSEPGGTTGDGQQVPSTGEGQKVGSTSDTIQ